MEIPDQSLSKDDPSAQPCWQQPGKESHPREGTPQADAADSSTLAESSTLSPISAYTYQNSGQFLKKINCLAPKLPILSTRHTFKKHFPRLSIPPF